MLFSEKEIFEWYELCMYHALSFPVPTPQILVDQTFAPDSHLYHGAS